LPATGFDGRTGSGRSPTPKVDDRFSSTWSLPETSRPGAPPASGTEVATGTPRRRNRGTLRRRVDSLDSAHADPAAPLSRWRRRAPVDAR
jgi:ribosomal protein S30